MSLISRLPLNMLTVCVCGVSISALREPIHHASPAAATLLAAAKKRLKGKSLRMIYMLYIL
jgi:hypothetical protein